MNELRKNYEMMLEVMNEANMDLAKFEAGNSSAGTRVRKAMQNVKDLAQQIRLAVQEIKNS
tara:strand:+ start:881 stop:1063 length:183 start_codon:yes stop_codon:yes gene_type:complete